MNELPEQNVWRGVNFWTEEIKKAGLLDNLRFFNDIITEQRPPNPESGYGNPVLTDVILDGKKVDIYHTDKNDSDIYHRLFLHIKE